MQRNGANSKTIARMLEKSLKCTDDDPPLVADWFLENLWAVLNNPNLQVDAPALPPELVLPEPLTISGLKRAILRSIRGAAPAPALIGETFGLECTGAQVGSVGAAAAIQCFHPWWIYQDQQSMNTNNISICPIAQLWVSRPRSNNMSRTADVPVPDHGVPLFL
jgi:hypothetical protein